MIEAEPDDILIVVGDFNLPQVKWRLDEDDSNVLLPIAFKPNFSEDFLNGLIGNGLYQINSFRNDKGNLLDLFFTNDHLNSSIEVASEALVKIDVYHPPLLVTFEWHSPHKAPATETHTVLNFKRADFNGMNEYFESVNFDELFADKQLEEKVDACMKCFKGAFNNLFPFK